jgi:hypothetical protein
VDPFSFTLERTGSDQVLRYQEPGHALVFHLEASAAPQFDWLVCDNDLAAWAEPERKGIAPAKRKEIVERLASWAAAERVRIALGPCRGGEGFILELEREGWRDQMTAEGGVTYWR